MPHDHVHTIGVLSTYPPTQCGLATFAAALHAELADWPGRVGVVRVVDTADRSDAPEVVHQLLNGSPRSAATAIGVLNRYDSVLVHHEYGIYGGPDGSDVVELLEALTVPVVIVFHTVLASPTRRQRWILERLLSLAGVAVTMTETARSRLVSSYGADPDGVVMIPHGAVRQPAGPARAVGPSPLLLTWGLIGPGKGIEWAIDAVAGLRDLRPRYVVAGTTHPKVLERQGEAYRASLQARAHDRGVADLVHLDDDYRSVGDLAKLVAAADLVVLPYDSRDQVTSGVLIEAVAAGRPVVSTAFPHAVELLDGGPGIVVPRRDPDALGAAIRRVLTEPGLAERLAALAAEKAPELFWDAVAARYRALADRLARTALEPA